MKILIIGKVGQLGWELYHKGKDLNFDICALDLPEFDITNQGAVKKAINKDEYSLVINASAYTAVDKAETEVDIAFAVNKNGPAYIASCCADARIPMIHVSTDYVFKGDKKEPYLETDLVCPVGIYGKSKADGEQAIRETLQEHIILRTAWLYGVHGNNFVKTMLRLAKEKDEVSVVDDQFGCPTFAADLAEAILTISGYICEGRKIEYGTYHFCGNGKTSWCGFAKKAIELAKGYEAFKIKNVKPITTEEYPTLAKRPANSVMDCTQLNKTFGIYPPNWEESLEKAIQILYTI